MRADKADVRLQVAEKECVGENTTLIVQTTVPIFINCNDKRFAL
jgi:hypothetical protein